MEDVVTIKRATVILEGNKVLKEINLSIAEREHHFILGANGSGKTTLMNLVMGYVWPIFGAEVSIMGNLYGKSNLTDVRKRISWVSSYLQNWTNARWPVAEIVVSGLDGTIGLYRNIEEYEYEKAIEILKQLDADDLVERSFSHLSSGEQMKVLIARALISQPKLIILDEACVHLDLKTREFLLESIEKLASGESCPTILFITQRIEDISPVFAKGIILRKGEIIASGLRDEIISEDNLKLAFDIEAKLIKTKNNRYWTVLN